jgi:hypothetical protein
MRLGTATIVSNAGALGEVCGDAAPAVRPDDAEGLAELMERLMRSPGERRSWVLDKKANIQSAFTG